MKSYRFHVLHLLHNLFFEISGSWNKYQGLFDTRSNLLQLSDFWIQMQALKSKQVQWKYEQASVLGRRHKQEHK